MPSPSYLRPFDDLPNLVSYRRVSLCAYDCRSSLQFVLSQVIISRYFKLISRMKADSFARRVMTDCLPLPTVHAHSALLAINGFGITGDFAVNVYFHIQSAVM